MGDLMSHGRAEAITNCTCGHPQSTHSPKGTPMCSLLGCNCRSFAQPTAQDELLKAAKAVSEGGVDYYDANGNSRNFKALRAAIAKAEAQK